MYFVLINILLYTTSITAHYNLGQNALVFSLMFVINLAVLLMLVQITQVDTPYVFIIYSVMYGLFAFIGFIDFDILYWVIMMVYFWCGIRLFAFFIPKYKPENLIVFDYAIDADFLPQYANQNYGIPIHKDLHTHRQLSDEIHILREYNQLIDFKNKIPDSHFETVLSRLNQNIPFPKGAVLLAYKNLLLHCKQGVYSKQTEPISFKFYDEEQIKAKEDAVCLIEFKIDRSNLIMMDNISIQKRFLQLNYLAQENQLNVGFRYGFSKDNNKGVHYFVLRVMALEWNDSSVSPLAKPLSVQEDDVGQTFNHQESQEDEIEHTFDMKSNQDVEF